MPQFLIERPDLHGDIASIKGTDAKHIVNVLRLGKGDWLMLTDGRGGRYKAVIISASAKEVMAKVSPAPVKQRADAQVILAQALVKHDKFEFIIQKSVELGCSSIIPFTSERTVPKIADAASKMKRWQKIADEAAKQCGTVLRPEIAAPRTLAKLIEDTKDIEQRILFFEGDTSNNLRTHALTHSRTLLMIGPEGGFSAKEVELALSGGFVSCGLGPLILRADTASIAGLTLIQDQLGYFE